MQARRVLCKLPILNSLLLSCCQFTLQIHRVSVHIVVSLLVLATLQTNAHSVGESQGPPGVNSEDSYHLAGYRPADVPEPSKHPVMCRADIGDYADKNHPVLFCDPAKRIKLVNVFSINRLLTNLRQDFPCPCKHLGKTCANTTGYKFVVVVVPAIHRDAYFEEDKYEQSRKFSENILAQNWTKASCGEDLVIFLSIDARKIYIARGSLFESLLPPNCIQAILDETNKFVLTETYGDGLVHVIKQIREIIRGDRICPQGMLWWQLVYLLIVAVLTVLVGGMCCCFCSVRTSGFRYHRSNVFESNYDDGGAGDAMVGGAAV